MGIYKYKIHFEFDEDIEINVTVETTFKAEDDNILDLAIEKLAYNGMAALVNIDTRYSICEVDSVKEEQHKNTGTTLKHYL